MAGFLAWQRPSVYGLAIDPPASARLTAKLPITFHDDLGDLVAPASFLLAGPGDVAGLAAGQVIGRRPHPGSVDAEATMMAHVELAAPDLPWRYSPVAHTPGMTGLRPWLVLVVGTPSEVTLLADGRVRLSGASLFDAHPLAGSHRWAHVHEVPGRKFSRIVSPRSLVTGQNYLAVLVPAWRAVVAPDGSSSLVDSWPTASGTVTLPCFDRWTFRTTEDPGDFAAVAKRLEPLSDAEATVLAQRSFGRAQVTVGPVPDTTLATGGALVSVPPPGAAAINEPLLAPIAQVIEPLAANLSDGDRWVLSLPRYDAPWHPGPVDGEEWQWPPPGDDVVPDGWRRQLRVDPRHRGAAGLGAWVGIAWQDRITGAAADQAAAVAAAAQRIRQLNLGLGAARSLWNRRVPTEPLARLATLSPMLARLPAAGGGSALEAVTGRTPMLVDALFSSTARRMLRRRGPLARSATKGATVLGGLIEAANRCPDLQAIPPSDSAVIDALADPAADEALREQLRERASDTIMELTGDEHLAGEVQASLSVETIDELIGTLRQSRPENTCRPLTDLGAFADSVAGGIDPTVTRPVIIDRVVGTIGGLREPVMAEPDVAPELDIPLWQFLSDNSPDWLLPGAADIPADRLLAVQTNPEFIDAFLIGANHQTLGELRWRNIPITTRWTPLRRFWERIDPSADAVGTDIVPVVSLATDADIWSDAEPLGASTHRDDSANGTELVIVFHTELFRRYPATVVYLTPNDGGTAIWGPTPDVDSEVGGRPPRPRAYPTFSGKLSPELVFFGFGLPPSAVDDHWLVLEEPPPGYRFKHPEGVGHPGDAATDGAAFAVATFAPPTRVFFGNLL